MKSPSKKEEEDTKSIVSLQSKEEGTIQEIKNNLPIKNLSLKTNEESIKKVLARSKSQIKNTKKQSEDSIYKNIFPFNRYKKSNTKKTKQSLEPVPIIRDTESVNLTPSELDFYFDYDKDLVETSVCKNQMNSLLNQIKSTFKKQTINNYRVNLEEKNLNDNCLKKNILNEINLNVKKNLSEGIIQTNPTTNDFKLNLEKENSLLELSESKEIKRENNLIDSSFSEKGKLITSENKNREAVVLYSCKNKKKTRKKKKKKKKTKDELKIGFIGAGKLSEALVETLINVVKVSSSLIHISSPSGRNLNIFKTKGCQTTKRNIDIFVRFNCDIVFLCFHGGVVKYCYKLGGKKPFPLTTTYIPINSQHRFYILSLVTGVSLDDIKNILFNPDLISQQNFEIHRVLLSVCSAFKSSICGINCEVSQLSNTVKTFLEKFGKIEFIPENEMDAACALAGNGLAFAYYLLNAISDGSVRIGLCKNKSIKLIAQIANSSVECLDKIIDNDINKLLNSFFKDGHPANSGLQLLKKKNIASGLENAIKTAFERIKELATIDIAPAFTS